LWVKEKHRPTERPPFAKIASLGWKSFWRTLRRMAGYKPLITFLVAYLLYIDGVNTIIKMAVDYGMALGFKPQHLIGALLLVQFIGFPAAIGFGFLANKWGARRGIFICLWVYGFITVLAFLMKESWHFYALASVIGLVQGGVQALSRSIFARMIPPHEAGEFFGFFNLLGKFSAIVGPLLVGTVSLLTGEPRWSILVLLLLFVSGGWLLKRVDGDYRVPA
jgi:UMF1 family MFS transporter